MATSSQLSQVRSDPGTEVHPTASSLVPAKSFVVGTGANQRWSGAARRQ